ncbi:MAG: hypothetical protein H6813_03675 [Phycisphaeraceae bacterium]|nr:hypothetical protein [Phycisphaeraceae bacterium]MCB9847047.1 hypothetical protein [Phycisphaeraceae bacterium]
MKRLLRNWALALGIVFCFASTLFALLGTPYFINNGAPVLGWLDPIIGGAMVALLVTPLMFVLSAIKTQTTVGARFDDSRCPHCDYDLTGLASDRCPECGSPLEAARDLHQRSM